MNTENDYVYNIVITEIYITIFCYKTLLKETIWPRGDSNLRRDLSQQTC